ncbi:MAG: hypothetical protein ACF8MJ_08455 [Phycisphaerales bacterium JB050]
MTWRLAESDGLLLAKSEQSVECLAVRLPDHRAVYLTHEGEVGGGRGKVVRIASGNWTPMANRDDAIELAVRFHTLWRVRGERIGEAPDPADRGSPPLGLWRLHADPVEHREAAAAVAPNS